MMGVRGVDWAPSVGLLCRLNDESESRSQVFAIFHTILWGFLHKIIKLTKQKTHAI